MLVLSVCGFIVFIGLTCILLTCLQVMMASYAQPPSVAPQKLTPSKPRSYSGQSGNAGESPSTANVDSSGEGNGTRSGSFGSTTSDTSQSSVGDGAHVRPVKRIPPPKPKPMVPTSSAGAPIRRFNFETHEARVNSPPPPPPPRRESSQNLLIGKQSSIDASLEEYSLLANATTSSSTSLGTRARHAVGGCGWVWSQ